MELTPQQWIEREDSRDRQGRVKRLQWLMSLAPESDYWFFDGGPLAKYLFEEARYSFVYGQFLASTLTALAFVERELAATFYGIGRNDLERANFSRLVEEAASKGWLTTEQAQLLGRTREIRNSMAHFRRPLHPGSLEARSIESNRIPYDVIEGDARGVLQVMFLFVKRQMAEVPSERFAVN
jgi:hypothetical protein